MNEDRHDNEVVDDRPYSRRWLVRGAAAFAVVGGIGAPGLIRWASASYHEDDDHENDHNEDDHDDDEYDDRESRDDDDHLDDKDDHDDDDHDDDHDDDDDHAGASSATTPRENRVEIRDEAFVPASITINAGEWVTWINFDDDEHTATGEDFDTGVLELGARAEIQFNTPGTFVYTCQFHPEMTGEVTVQFGAATPEASPIASPEASPAVTPATGGGQEAVSIIDFAFEPQTLQIAVGTTLVWTNDGEAPHTVTGGPLDSGTLRAGDSFQFTFNTAGTIDYVCAFHPQMTGTIEVTG